MNKIALVTLAAGIALSTAGASFAQTTVTTTNTKDQAASGGAVAGATTGAVGGAIVGGPIGAVGGAIAGAAVGAVTAGAITPSAEVREYVVQNPVQPIAVQESVRVGTALPETVALTPIPNYKYSYVYVNNEPVLVDPSSRKIVYVVQ